MGIFRHMTLIHYPGHSMGKLDALLQRPDHGNGASDNKDVILLRLELLAIKLSKKFR